LYNFICLHKSVENEDQEVNTEILEDDEVVQPFVQRTIASIMNKRRDKLVKDMWEDYCMYIGRDI
jgi:hypothetical protein